MAFWGNSFIFNDIPCEDFELMIYNIDNNTQSAGKFASNVEAVEDQIPGRWKPFFYNTKMTGKLSFSIVFGVNQQRYQRRVKARAEKKARRLENADDFNTVFSYKNLYHSYRCCRRGVSWKASVQRYISTAPLSIYQTRDRLLKETYRSPGFFEFDLYERGKKRHIRSTVIGERVVQRCLCDNALVPALTPTFVYDNGASIKHKGYDFCVRRMTQHLHEHYRKYGQDGYILLYDFSKFFDNVSHEVVKGIFDKTFTDEKLKRLAEHFVDAFGDVGLGLGSQISQVLALASANQLDHYIKEVLQIRGYGRYMDDGYLIHPSKEYLQKCLSGIKEICNLLGIKLNQKKTQLVKLSHGFIWLKARVFLTKTGKVIKKICKKSITRMRRKLKRLKKRLDAGTIAFRDIWNSWQSWRGYAEKFNAWHTIQSMKKLFNKLFGFKEGILLLTRVTSMFWRVFRSTVQIYRLTRAKK